MICNTVGRAQRLYHALRPYFPDTADDGLPNPPGAVTASWSQVSGPGVALFTNRWSASTTVKFTRFGTYVLAVTADDGGALPSISQVTIR